MQEFTFTLNMQQLAVIEQGLVELPFKVANPMLHLIQTQVRQQQMETARRQAEPPVPGAIRWLDDAQEAAE